MRNILTSNAFFDSDSYRSKVKDPLEFINSTVRALDASVDALNFEGYMEDMGMHVFDRDEPDGWPETGVDWITTSGMLTRIKFVQDLNASTVHGQLHPVADRSILRLAGAPDVARLHRLLDDGFA